MEISIFTQLSIVIVIGATVALIMRLLRQPLIVGYILTGVLIGPAFLHLVKNQDAFESFSQIGIALLLFIIGLELNTNVIRRMGKVVAVVSAIQILISWVIGYCVSFMLGFSPLESLILAVALTFSSTIIIIKTINDKKEYSRLYAHIAIGVLLVQDIVATIALVLLAAGKTGSLSPIPISILIAKGLIISTLLWGLSKFVLPKIKNIIAGSQEFLFLFALAWGFGIAALFELSGFSIEVGALFAGVSLASLPYAQEIGARLKPLRDFFVVVFFIKLGEGFQLDSLTQALIPSIILSLVVIITKPLLVMVGMGLMGYTKRSSFKTALTMGQISEFSIIFIVLATNGHLISHNVEAVVTLTAFITIAVSTYLMQFDDKLFTKYETKLQMFERKITHEKKHVTNRYQLMLFGYHKGGYEFVKAFRQLRKKFVIIDYDPEVIEHLEHQSLPYVYGDATDIELLEEIGIDKVKLVISTMTDIATNMSLLRCVRKNNHSAVFISHADNHDQAAELYKLGATYVILPHQIGSERVSSFIKRNGLKHSAFDTYREHHMSNLGRLALEKLS
jgi:Kef-type K+ transport system membrane component KefB